VRRPEELQGALGITPFVTIPFIETTRSRVLRRSLRLATVMVVLFGIPASLWALHAYVMPLEQLSRQLLESVGLA
jgi:succinoglycan biosynthesis transport protein ExoP